MLYELHFVQNLQISCRNGGREAPVCPLNRHFMSADLRENGAEMTQIGGLLPRIHRRAIFAFAWRMRGRVLPFMTAMKLLNCLQ